MTSERRITWSDLKVGDVLITLGDDGPEPSALISIECMKPLNDLKQHFCWKKGTFLNLLTGATFGMDLNDYGVLGEIVRAT